LIIINILITPNITSRNSITFIKVNQDSSTSSTTKLILSTKTSNQIYSPLNPIINLTINLTTNLTINLLIIATIKPTIGK